MAARYRQPEDEWEEEEEEEEEEDEYWRPRGRVQQRELEEEDIDVPEEEDVLRAAGSAALGAWSWSQQLRRRGPAVPAAPAAPRMNGGGFQGGLFGDDEDFALGSERLLDPAPPLPGWDASAATSLWRQALLGLLVMAGAFASASDRRPSEASFAAMREERYGQAGNASGTGRPWLPPYLDWLVQADRSFEGRVAWSRYVDHGPIALATVALSVAGGQASGSKGKKAPRKVYEHRYVGVLGQWVPLPYLPQPGQKPGTYGVGACVLARCICAPNPRPNAGKAAGKAGGAGGGGRSCWRFEGGKSAALNVMAVPNIVLFGLWQWPTYWGRLAGHATLSLANLGRGRVWVLLAAPFSHRGWGEIFRSGILLANAVDSFDRAGVSFAVFLALYLGGCWMAWLARGVVWKRLFRGDPSAFYAQEWGASGGLAAQLLFLARARPQERFQFSMYFIPLPLDLSAWQSLFAHGLMDIASAPGEVTTQLLAHLAAWGFGWFVYDAWARHA